MPRSCLQIDKNLVAKSVVEKIEVNETSNHIVVMNDPERDGQQSQEQKCRACRSFVAHDSPEIEDKTENHMRPTHRYDEHLVALFSPGEATECERGYSQNKSQQSITKRQTKRRRLGSNYVC